MTLANDPVFAAMVGQLMPMLSSMINPELIESISSDIGEAIAASLEGNEWVCYDEHDNTQFLGTTQDVVRLVLNTVFTALQGDEDCADCPPASMG